MRALDYLLKPFTQARFREAVQYAREQIQLRDVQRDQQPLAPPQVIDADAGCVWRYLMRENGRYIILSMRR